MTIQTTKQSGLEAKGPTRPTSLADIVQNDAEAISIALRLAGRFTKGSGNRDATRHLPLKELDEFSQSGLWGITIPKKYGGAGVSYATVAEVIRIIAAADPSIAQIPQNHIAVLDLIRLCADEEQKQMFFGEVLNGLRLGNAFSEKGSKTAGHFDAQIRHQDKGYTITGEKFYCTGALLAHLVPVSVTDEAGLTHIALVERDNIGLIVTDDWSSFGQRTTASGTVVLKNAYVPATHVIPAYKAFDRPTSAGPVAQIPHAAVDLGIASAAISATIEFVKKHTRPWIDSGQEHGYEDMYTISDVGRLMMQMHAAEAILAQSGKAVDLTIADPTTDSVARASIAVAEAKILTTEIALTATNKLFELAGTKSTLSEYQLDRHWRNARTHTLHDPVRWKYQAVGNYYLNAATPPRHAWL